MWLAWPFIFFGLTAFNKMHGSGRRHIHLAVLCTSYTTTLKPIFFPSALALAENVAFFVLWGILTSVQLVWFLYAPMGLLWYCVFNRWPTLPR